MIDKSAQPEPNFRKCERCDQRQSFHIADISREGVLTEMHLCEDCAKPILTKPLAKATWSAAGPEEVEIEVERVVVTELYPEQVITLREVLGDRRFSILIGYFEACAIDRELKDFVAPRPLTHDGWLSTIHTFGGILEQVCINSFEGHIYRTELRLRVGNSQAKVDVRPSDGIMLALKADAPILIPAWLLAKVFHNNS